MEIIALPFLSPEIGALRPAGDREHLATAAAPVRTELAHL